MKGILRFGMALACLACVVSTAWALGDTYEIEDDKAYRVISAEKKIPLDDVAVNEVMAPPASENFDPSILPTYAWFAVSPELSKEMKGAKPGIFLQNLDDPRKKFFLPMKEAPQCAGIYINHDEDRLVMDLGTESIQILVLYDLAARKVIERLAGIGTVIWIDAYRFVYTAYEPQKQRGREESFDLWSSVVLYSIYDGKGDKTVIRKATETANYILDNVDMDKDEFIIMEETVNSPKDWKNPDKIKEKEIREAFPAAG